MKTHLESFPTTSPSRSAVSAVYSDEASTNGCNLSPFRRDRYAGMSRREVFNRKMQRAVALNHSEREEKKIEDEAFRSDASNTSVPIRVPSTKIDNNQLNLPPISSNGKDRESGAARTNRIIRKRQLLNRNFENATEKRSTASPGRHLGLFSSVSRDERQICDGDNDSAVLKGAPLPQHYETGSMVDAPSNHNEHDIFYRVIYKGVVALMTEPAANAPKSGAYLSYGEIFTSSLRIPIENGLIVDRVHSLQSRVDANKALNPQSISGSTGAHNGTDGTPTTLTELNANSLQSRERSPLALASTKHSLEVHGQQNPKDHASCSMNSIIRVDRVVTGGYAVDAEGTPASEAETPKRSNMDYYLPIGGLSSSSCHVEEGVDVVHNPHGVESLGFLFERMKDVILVEAMVHKPRVEKGNFQYQVISSTPLPILAGPSLDAPRTKAMALPGTVHNVCLRLSFGDLTQDSDVSGVWFLRLRHRRGWVVEKRISQNSHAGSRWLTVMREIINNDDVSSFTDDLSAVSSVASSSAMTTSAAVTRRRHRPPRRLKEIKDGADLPPRHIGKAIQPNLSSSSKSMSRSFDHGTMTTSSNVSILSDDSSIDRSTSSRRLASAPTSPGDHSQISTATSNVSHLKPNHISEYYLMRVTAPRGLKILDAPQFQVSNLIRGTTTAAKNTGQLETISLQPKSHHSIFQTMSSRIGSSSSGGINTSNPAIYDAGSKSRLLPRGAIFESSKRMESTGAYSQGAGLIKLSDGSGWAVVPRKEELDQQYRNYYGKEPAEREGKAALAYEEVGRATIDSSIPLASDRSKWVRVICRTGIAVACPPPLFPLPDDETSPSSSHGSAAVSVSNHGSSFGHESDVASSVASSFVDAMMFRSPKKRAGKDLSAGNETSSPKSSQEKHSTEIIIPCGMCLEVESYSANKSEYARLLGGQGWVPLQAQGKEASVEVPRPDFRIGSFWFRVLVSRGIKVRLGPSKRSPSIKSEEGVHFRFECGEFLRASEIMTTFSHTGEPLECFAKLYRNRHARLHHGEEYGSLQSLAVQAEWVQIFNEEELYLEECSEEPRIERHKQGWRYNVVLEEGIPVRKGPSFSSETTGEMLMGGQSVVVNERVVPAGEKITWLRMKDGEGWLHDVDHQGKELMVAHSLRHRAKSAVASRPNKVANAQEEIAYNAIISRLFHND